MQKKHRLYGNNGVRYTAIQITISHIEKDKNLIFKWEHVKTAKKYTNAT